VRATCVRPRSGQSAAGENAVPAAGNAVPDLHVHVPQPIAAVADARSRDRVRDERDAATGRAPNDASRFLGDVVTVEDHLDDHVVACKRGPGNTRVAVPERPHRVEEVRHRCRAAVEGEGGLLCRRVRVAAGGDDSARVQQVDQLERAVQLGRKRHLRDRACSEQALQECGVRVAAGVDRVGAEAERREERPLEMGADHARPDRVARDLGQRCHEVLLGRRDHRRLKGRDAVLE
jgi:hypothetical protein